MTKDKALRFALEALELSHPRFGIGTAIHIKAVAVIKEALAQPEQEPVQTIPSFTQLQQIIKNLEHCLSRDSKQEFLRVWIRDWTEHKLSQYIPPQRTLIGLTDEEREQVINANTSTGLWHMAKDIEAKLKEKNT